jgi:hypothetical protein
MCFGFGALQRALRRPHVATVSVKCRLTNGWRLRRKQKDVLFQSLVAKWPFTAPPDLYHVNEETDTISRERQVKVKLLTTNAKSNSTDKNRSFRDYGVAEATPIFQ